MTLADYKRSSRFSFSELQKVIDFRFCFLVQRVYLNLNEEKWRDLNAENVD